MAVLASGARMDVLVNVVKITFGSVQRTFGQSQEDFRMHGHLVSEATTKRQYSINSEAGTSLVSECPLGLDVRSFPSSFNLAVETSTDLSELLLQRQRRLGWRFARAPAWLWRQV